MTNAMETIKIELSRNPKDPQLSEFIYRVSTDESLKKDIKAISSVEELIGLMKKSGFQIEAEIFESDELREEDLKTIVGGIRNWAINGADLLRPFAIELGVAGGEPWQTRPRH